MDNTYLVVNGVKVPLTDEQKKSLGLTFENPFAKPATRENYYYITSEGAVGVDTNVGADLDNRRFDKVNCFKNRTFANGVAKKQLLYRMLLKFAYDNDAVDLPWDRHNYHFYIRYEYNDGVDEPTWEVAAALINRSANEVYFSKESVAREAIEEIVKPFFAAFPETADYNVYVHTKEENKNE